MNDDPAPPRVTFTFDGRAISAPAGQTVGAALASAGVWDLSHSLKYHRPQGLVCMSGHCGQCLVRIDGLPNRYACRTLARDGMVVERQNVLVSRRLDPVYFAYRLGWRLDHYRIMTRPRWLNAIFRKVARRLSGLGRLPDAPLAKPLPQRSRKVDVLLVGAGPAGIAAAEALSRAGRQVLWIDENTGPGGSLSGLPEAMLAEVKIGGVEAWTDTAHLPGIEWSPDSLALGYFEDAGFVVRTPEAMLSVRADIVILATGATDALPAFCGNELPGVLTPGGALRLLVSEGVRPEGPVVLGGDSPRIHRIARALHERGDRVILCEAVAGARGHGRIRNVRIVRDGRPRWMYARGGIVAAEAGQCPRLELFQQTGGPVAWNQDAGAFHAAAFRAELPDGGVVWVAGDALVPGGPADAARLGGLTARLATENAQADLPAPPPRQVEQGSQDQNALVCTCEDVLVSEIRHAIAAGYNDMELLKRYTGLATGPCQGKSCLAAAARLLSEHAPPQPTRFRPPVQPVSLAELAGEDADA